MPDQGTILLYALSTFAQTCAALAAFVGAVGLYKLQSLRDENARTEQTIRGLMANVMSPADAMQQPIVELLRVARINVSGPSSAPAGVIANLQRALFEWDNFIERHRRATTILVVFETWNLSVVGASLVGFNYVPMLMSSPWTFRAVWAAAAGTVVVTISCVLAWTGTGQFWEKLWK